MSLSSSSTDKKANSMIVHHLSYTFQWVNPQLLETATGHKIDAHLCFYAKLLGSMSVSFLLHVDRL